MTENQIYTEPTSAPETPQRRQLTRSRADKMVGGVCGGMAAYFNIDATVLRLLVVAAVVFGFGTGIILYLAAWLLLPTERPVAG